MSRVLSELLGAEEPQFSHMVRELESVCGLPNADIRLAAEIEQKARHKIKELGLDEYNITGEELYVSLQHLAQIHDEFIAKKLGAKDATDVKDLLPRIKKTLDTLPVPRSCWVMKHSTARRLLKKTPPKRVMKVLGYRSIDSMLKRENIDELYASLRFIESAQWMERFTKLYKQLGAQDFEMRDIQIYLMSSDKWGNTHSEFVERRRKNFTYLKELGVIAVMPMPIKHLKGLSITLLPLLVHAMNEIRLYSAFFKLHQVRTDFGEILFKTLARDDAHSIKLAGQSVHWRHVSRFFGEHDLESYSEVFEPHVQPEDLRWHQAEEVLYKIVPALKFWEEMEFVALAFDGRPVSFNLIDNAVSYCNGLQYSEQAVSRMRENLWTKLWVRYMEQEAIENQLIRQLSDTSVELVDIELSINGRVVA